MAKRKNRNRQSASRLPATTGRAPRPDQLRIGNEQLQVSVQTTKTHTGPLPTPEDLARYEQIHAGIAERIVRMAEIPLELAVDQHNHRVAIEKQVITSDIRRSWAGMIIGGIVSLTAVVGGIILVAADKPAPGITAILTPIAAIAGIFVHSDRERRKERRAQMQSMQ